LDGTIAEGKRLLERPKLRSVYNIKIRIKVREFLSGSPVSRQEVTKGSCEHDNETLSSMKGMENSVYSPINAEVYE
jgi:hypothetical protein